MAGQHPLSNLRVCIFRLLFVCLLFSGCHDKQASQEPGAPLKIIEIQSALDNAREPQDNTFSLLGDNLEGGKIALYDHETRQPVEVLTVLRTKPRRIRFAVDTSIIDPAKKKNLFIFEVRNAGQRLEVLHL